AKDILIRSATAFYAARHPGKVPSLSTADEALANALADLAVTGRSAWNSFRAQSPNEEMLVPAVSQRLAQLPATPTAADVASATSAALDRAYNVAAALRGPYLETDLRASLGWIAVSGEDDPPHRPVNVGSPPYPQYEIPVTVGGITLQTRFFIASPTLSAGVTTISPPPAYAVPPAVSPGVSPVSRPASMVSPRVSSSLPSPVMVSADKFAASRPPRASPETPPGHANRSIPSDAVPVVPLGHQ